MRHFTLLVIGTGLFVVSVARAIPNQHLNPHSDAPGDISWPNPAPGVPNNVNHFHLVLRAGETITQNANSISSNKNWAADSVWDDRFYRFADGNSDKFNDNAATFGHGFIDPNFQPRYWFNSVPAAAQPLLTQTFSSWNTAAQAAATAVGNKTPANNQTVTSIAFQNVADQASAEFQILFANNVQSTQGAFAEWIASSAQDQPGGPALSALTMVYEANPSNSVFFQNGSNWQLRIKDTDAGTPGNQPGAWGSSYSQNVGWFYGAGSPTVLGSVDFEYRDSTDPGNVFDSLTAGADALKDNCFGTYSGAGAANAINFYPMDFQTIALHETGHILGLLHDPSSANGGAGNIMRTNIAFNAGFGSTMRAIDGDSAYGAAILYTIPVPEPVAMCGLLIATLLIHRKRG